MEAEVYLRFIQEEYPEISQSDTKKKSNSRYTNTLEKVASFESEINKPFEQFTQKDFVNLFEKYNWTAANTFHSNKSLIKEFAHWYFSKVIGVENIPFGHPKYSPIEHIALSDVSSEKRLKREYFKDADDFFACLVELYGSLNNDRYIMPLSLFVLLWEGLSSTEAQHLKVEDMEISPEEMVLHLKDRSITIVDKRSCSVLRSATLIDGYDIISTTGYTASYTFANTGMLLRATKKHNYSWHEPVRVSITNRFFADQALLADELPKGNFYHGKRLVHRGLSNSAAFFRLVQMKIQGRATQEQLAAAFRTPGKSYSEQKVYFLNQSFTEWKVFFGY